MASTAPFATSFNTVDYQIPRPQKRCYGQPTSHIFDTSYVKIEHRPKRKMVTPPKEKPYRREGLSVKKIKYDTTFAGKPTSYNRPDRPLLRPVPPPVSEETVPIRRRCKEREARLYAHTKHTKLGEMDFTENWKPSRRYIPTKNCKEYQKSRKRINRAPQDHLYNTIDLESLPKQRISKKFLNHGLKESDPDVFQPAKIVPSIHMEKKVKKPTVNVADVARDSYLHRHMFKMKNQDFDNITACMKSY
ncbi:hypothetical protein PCE1_001631 [Barthelona sp. PCE]